MLYEVITPVGGAHLLDESLHRAFFHQGNGAAPETGAGHPGADASLGLPGFLEEGIELQARHLVVVPEGYVGSSYNFV